MSQIDRLTFIPHLFWFVVLFLIFYFVLFSYILPLIYEALRVRRSLLLHFVNSPFFNFIFCYVVLFLDEDTFFFVAILTLYHNLKQTYDFRCILMSGVEGRTKNIRYIK